VLLNELSAPIELGGPSGLGFVAAIHVLAPKRLDARNQAGVTLSFIRGRMLRLLQVRGVSIGHSFLNMWFSVSIASTRNEVAPFGT